MSRILEALRQIEAKARDAQRGIQPVSAEELEAFGLRRPAPPEASSSPPSAEEHPAPEPAEPAGRVQPKEPIEPDRPLRRSDEPAATPDWQKGESVRVAGPGKPDLLAGRWVGRPPEEPCEPYRKLADNVLDRLPSAQGAVLMFTSVGDGEGKTTTLASLAIVLAERVTDPIVAVDANLRSPRLASQLGIRARRGLIDVLAGAADWREVIRETTVDRLLVLPGGRPTGHPQRGSPDPDGGPAPEAARLASVLDALRREHPIVLVDTAALCHAGVARISEWCEGTYLVIRLGQTGRRAARQAVRLVAGCGGRVLGCVLTDVPLPT